MPEHRVAAVQGNIPGYTAALEPIGAAELEKLLNEGWVPNPEVHTHSCDGVVVYCLVKYSDEEKAAMMPQPEVKPDLRSLALDSIISVDIEKADEKLAEGYELLKDYAKTVTLIKRKTVKAEENKKKEGE